MGAESNPTNPIKNVSEAAIQESSRLIKDRVLSTLKDKYHLDIDNDPAMTWVSIWLDTLEEKFGTLENVRGKKALDLACGSLTSQMDGEEFKPWFPRILSELGADTVGIDIGSLEGEPYEHHRIDLSETGALDFLPEHAFDIIHLKAFHKRVPSPILKRLLIERKYGNDQTFNISRDLGDIDKELQAQVKRLLKEGGTFLDFEM